MSSRRSRLRLRALIAAFSVCAFHAPTAVAGHTTADTDAVASAKAFIRNKQFPAAIQELRAAAVGGDAQSEYLLGLAYANGIGTDVSADDARHWLEASASQSNADAAFALAGLLSQGSEQERARAREWLAQAATEGHPVAVRLNAAHVLPLAPSHDEAGDPELARELLLWAIRRGDLQALDALASAAGVENADAFERSPLEFAVLSGSAPAVRGLLHAGANRAHTDRFGVTALMLAAEAQNDEILDDLLNSGSPETDTAIDTRDKAGETALFYAARVGRADHVKRLIASGASLNISNGDGWTAVDVAAKYGHPETAQALREAGASARMRRPILRDASGIDPAQTGQLYQGWPPVDVAASRNDRKLVTELLTSGARADAPTPERDTPLLVAAKFRAADVIAPLLRAGANPALDDGNGETPVGFAAAHGELDVLDALLQKGVSPDIHGRGEEPPILRAARSRDFDVVRHLIDAGADVNARSSNGLTALMVSAAASDAKITRLLLGANSHVEYTDIMGRDALWFVADSGSEEQADLLLAAGAPVDSDRQQSSPLLAAIHAGRAGMLEHLLRKGLSPNPPSADGDTPLIAAAARGDPALVRILVDGGAAMDAQNDGGNTALIVAVREGHTEVCRALLQAGANARVRNVERIDALDTARRRNNTQIAALLGAH